MSNGIAKAAELILGGKVPLKKVTQMKISPKTAGKVFKKLSEKNPGKKSPMKLWASEVIAADRPIRTADTKKKKEKKKKK